MCQLNKTTEIINNTKQETMNLKNNMNLKPIAQVIQ